MNQPAFEEEEKKYGGTPRPGTEKHSAEYPRLDQMEQPKMDPNQTLSELRYLIKEYCQEHSGLEDIKERFEALDEWMSKGGFSPWPASSAPNLSANGQARMSDAQRNRLWQMCADYNVKFNEKDYFLDAKTGMVEGWVGGIEHANNIRTTIYTGVELNGRSHT